jgi:hypothetical protein
MIRTSGTDVKRNLPANGKHSVSCVCITGIFVSVLQVGLCLCYR